MATFQQSLTWPSQLKPTLSHRNYVHWILHASTAPAMHSIQHLVDNFSLVAGACQQGKQGMEPAQSQGAQHGWRQASATSTHPLAFEESKAGTHKPPSVGLQNTNTTSKPVTSRAFLQGSGTSWVTPIDANQVEKLSGALPFYF